jgi:hypothetical protein
MKLLDSFWFKNFKTSHVFKSVKEVNEFVLEYARNKVTFHGNIVDTMFSKGALHLTQCTKLEKGNFTLTPLFKFYSYVEEHIWTNLVKANL